MKDSSDIVRTGRKFEQVLDGARQVFLAQGFEGASVDDIARAAGVSKATIYSYFPDKRLMFMEMATRECSTMADQVMAGIDENAPIKNALQVAAQHLVGFLISEFAQQVFRACIAERDRFPELAQAFYDSGPKMGRERMAAYLACAVERGELKIDDLEMAAEQFSELCKARIWNRAMFGVQSEFTDAEIAYTVDSAVETFLARYGA